MTVQNLLPDFGYALWAERIGGAGPTERRLGLFVRLEQRLVGPLRRGRRVWLDAVEAIKHNPSTLGGGDCDFLYVLNRLAHFGLRLLNLWHSAVGSLASGLSFNGMRSAT